MHGGQAVWWLAVKMVWWAGVVSGGRVDGQAFSCGALVFVSFDRDDDS